MPNSAVVGILRVLLTADKAEFQKAMQAAAGDAKKFGKDLGTIGRQASDAGRTLTAAITLPLVGIGVAASKAAIDFESSFAGVRKTVKATDAEFGVMAQSMRDLAKTIPINVNELNRLGEAAGAMGIPKEAIVDFSRVMALLGVTTNVTSEQAAESIGKIQNIFGAAGKDTEKFASTLVALGNDGASTESQILEMATRIAGAGNTIGLTQGQVLGFASALASVGLEAEAGGTAISKVFINMASAVSEGGKGLDQFAKVAGMSAEQFSKRFKEDAAGAVLEFINGLGRIKQSGGDLIGTLAEMDIKEVRLRDTLLRMAGAGDLVAKALTTQGENWRVNGALIDEARERFKTTESQMTLLWSRIKDVGITLGNALLPAIRGSIGLLNELLPIVDTLAKGFASMPVPLQAMSLGLLAIFAAAGPVLLVFGQMALGAQSLIALFGPAGLATKLLTLTGGFSGLHGAASTLATTLGPAVLVAAVMGAMVAFDKLEESTRDSLQAVKDGNATWADLPSLLGNAVSRGINPLGAAFRDLSEIWKKVPGEIAVFKDAVVRISQQLYEGVKTWLVDRFAGIVESLRGKVEAVKGYFKDLYDKVIGNSYIPDLVDGVIREFGRLQGGMVAPSLVMTTETGNAFGGLKDRVLGDFVQMKDGILNALGDALSGASTWKDAFLDIWRNLQQGVSQIITDILNDVTGRFIKGLTGALTGQQGAWSKAFSGMLNIGGALAGGGNATAGLILGTGGQGAVIGIPGAAGGAGAGAGGAGMAGTVGSIAGGAAVGGLVGWGVGSQTGNKWGAGAAGAASGAAAGAALGAAFAPATLGLSIAVGALAGLIAGWAGAKRANVRANNDRDAFISQFGGQGTGEGSGFHNLQSELTKATGEVQGTGSLFDRLIKANDPGEFAERMQEVVKVLEAYRTKTEAATAAEKTHADAVAATKAEHEKRMDVLRLEMKTLDDAEAEWDRKEAPEKHMGTVEKRARAKIDAQKAVVQAAIDAQQQATQAMLDDLAKKAAESGTQSGDGISLGIQDGFNQIPPMFDVMLADLRERFKHIAPFRIPIEYQAVNLPSVPNPTPIPMSEGGFGRVTRPTLFLAGESGPESFAFSGANQAFSSGSMGGSTVLAPIVVVQREGESIESALRRAAPNLPKLVRQNEGQWAAKTAAELAKFGVR